jgi:hypothetical protein
MFNWGEIMCARAYCSSLAVLLLAAVTACSDNDTQQPSTTTTFKATLVGSSEVPPVATSATGNATIVVDAAKNLTYTVIFSGISSGVTLAHIHGPAAPGTNANIILGFTVNAGVVSGQLGPTTVSLTSALTGTINADSLIKLMNSGQAYVNVHSATNGGGEIRGWLAKQ